MGSVAPPFILCPLSESKELVGIGEDQSENRVIVTLGKNIAIRYHVLEQKQEASWTCSRHWFTSPVIFCPEFDKYGSVIDQSQVVLWDENDAHLASRKKYKFPIPIHSLKNTKDFGTLIIFMNGNVRCLEEAIKNRASTGLTILDESAEIIDDVIVNEKAQSVFVISRKKAVEKPTSKCGVEKADSLKISVLKFQNNNSESGGFASFNDMIVVKPEEQDILGGTVVCSGSLSTFVYLLSNGFLYRRPIQQANSTTQEFNPSKSKIANLENYISKTTPANISALNATTIAVYGCDPSEEGATVFIYDIKYDLMLSKQSLKLFGSPAIMFSVGNNLFVPVGLHILVLGVRLTKSLLSSMVGKHQIQGVDFFENRDPWVEPWEEEIEQEIKEDEDSGIKVQHSGFEDLVKLVNTLENNGQPQSMICGQIIPQILDRKSNAAISWITNYFNDIPEFLIVSLLTYLLTPMEKTAKRSVKVEPLDECEPNASMVKNDNDKIIYIFPSNLQVDNLLNRPFDQKEMMKSLRSMDFQLVKKLIQYLLNRMESSGSFDEDGTNEFLQLLKWTCVIFDSHYAQFVYHDETPLVESLQVLLNGKFEIMNEIEKLEPVLRLTLSKTSYTPGPSPNSKYRCETAVFD